VGVQLTTKFSDKIPAIELDRHLIEEGLRSIIKTALRGMEAGGELTVATYPNHRYAKIEIDGFRINPKPLDENQLLFPFYREPAFDGGIGIPLSQQIICQHGGNAVIKDGTNQWASLIITLPISRSSAVE
jgi:K+-sensing histidine kinase KdpD